MNPDTAKFRELIARYLARSAQKPVPAYASMVVNRKNYVYFSHHGKADTMNHSLAVFLINEDVRGLYVTYTPDLSRNGQTVQRYLVKTFDKTIKEGDFVVLPSALGERFNLAIAEVVDEEPDIDFDNTTPVPWVIQRVDMSQFSETLEQEELAIKQIKKAQLRDKRESLANTLLKAKGMDRLPLAKRRGIDD